MVLEEDEVKDEDEVVVVVAFLALISLACLVVEKAAKEKHLVMPGASTASEVRPGRRWLQCGLPAP